MWSPMRSCTTSKAVATAALFALIPLSTAPQYGTAPPKPGSQCGRQSGDLTYSYKIAVVEQLEPPNWKRSLVRISIGTATKLDLWTDGHTFKLWTSKKTLKEIDEFLLNLDKSCRLPAEPGDAAALLPVKWESADLTSAQFAQIHQDFLHALSQYVASAQERFDLMMQKKIQIVLLDATVLRIFYDNSYEQIQVDVFHDPDPEPKEHKPLVEWIRSIEKMAEDRFHHPIWGSKALKPKK